MTTLTLENKSAQYLQSFDQEVIGLLDAICAELEITPAMFELAKERYESIAAYLNEEGSPFRQYDLTIYPHGSTNLETTVKPINGAEHDVDVICRLLVQETCPQTAFLDMVYDRLKQRGCYTLKRMNRCVRVQYANEFHIDITPAIPDVELGPENILVTDKEVGRFKESNTKDYRVWFNRIAFLSPRISYADREIIKSFSAAAEPLPAPKFSKPMLNRIIQLMKRHRDVMFDGDRDAPISAIITTLTALSYEYHAKRNSFPNQIAFLQAVVRDMPNFITRVAGEERVPNPANPLENYADKWLRHPDRRTAFHKWHAAVVVHVAEVLGSADAGKLTLFKSLSSAYGENVVKAATVMRAELRRIESDGKVVGVAKTSGLIAPIAAGSPLVRAVMPVLRHTNFGC
jgi:hypothetical protein